MKSITIEPYSAGTEAHGLDAIAAKVMAEAGVDISGYRSKTLADLEGITFDYVITVCSRFDQDCPVFPGKTIKIHRGFDNPSALARNAASEEEALGHYRRVRDEIRDYVMSLPESLMTSGKTAK